MLIWHREVKKIFEGGDIHHKTEIDDSVDFTMQLIDVWVKFFSQILDENKEVTWDTI